MTPKLLCIDSATEVLSVALCVGDEVVSCINSVDFRSHSSKITSLITDCLKNANISIKQIDGIVVVSGPGSYTSLRIGISCAKALAYSMKIPLISIDSLTALVCGVKEKGKTILASIDARRDEIYLGVCFNNDIYKVEISSILLDAQFSNNWKDTPLVLIGNGSAKLSGYLSENQYKIESIQSNASYLAALAYTKFTKEHFENVFSFSPNYIKSVNITTSRRTLF